MALAVLLDVPNKINYALSILCTGLLAITVVCYGVVAVLTRALVSAVKIPNANSSSVTTIVKVMLVSCCAFN